MVEGQGRFWNRDYTREVGRHANRVSLDDDAEVRLPHDAAARTVFERCRSSRSASPIVLNWLIDGKWCAFLIQAGVITRRG